MIPIYRTGARPRREAFFAAGPPQGKNAPSGGSDPRSGERGGAFSAAGRACAGAFERLAAGRHFGKIVIRVDA
ncbi:hypothetical protein CE206_20410 [Achromobacter xylosoxidans]|nr:hypothetical protein CE206_20410 [Achromobacter xylosoxidans]